MAIINSPRAGSLIRSCTILHPRRRLVQKLLSQALRYINQEKPSDPHSAGLEIASVDLPAMWCTLRFFEMDLLRFTVGRESFPVIHG